MALRILIVTTYSTRHVNISSPLNNLSHLLSERGHRVTILDRGGKPGDKIQIRGVSTIKVKAVKKSVLDLAARLRYHLLRNSYDWFVSVDSPALVATFLALCPNQRCHVHLSLELLCPGNLRERILRKLEVMALRHLPHVIVQDEERARMLIGRNSYNPSQVTLVPASRIGEYANGKHHRWFHERFKLPAASRIVLLTGSLCEEHRTLQAVKAAATLPSTHVLVIHGWFNRPAYQELVLAEIKQACGKVILSTDLLPDGSLEQLFTSADIGYVCYSAPNANMKYIGKAAGKIHDFMRFGIPLVVNRDTNAYQFVVAAGCGVSIREPSELGAAVLAVEADYGAMSRAGLTVFRENEFSVRFPPLLSKLEVSDRATC